MTHKIFKHTRTGQVVSAQLVSKNTVHFNGVSLDIGIVTTSGWQLCAKDPGYRGMPNK